MKEGMLMDKRNGNRRPLELVLVIKKLSSNEVEELAVKVKDVSKSGIGFRTKEILQFGSVYECELILWNKEKIRSFLEVIRMEKLEEDIIYGAIFIGMPETDHRRIEIYDVIETMKEREVELMSK